MKRGLPPAPPKEGRKVMRLISPMRLINPISPISPMGLMGPMRIPLNSLK